MFREGAEHYGVVRASQEAALSDPEFARMERRIQSWTQSHVLAALQILARHPTARPNVDLSRFAHMMDRHFWSLLARGGRLSCREMNREVRLAADVIHHYLFGPTLKWQVRH